VTRKTKTGGSDREGSETHETRVHGAFESLHRRVKDRLDEEARGSVDGLRDAAARRDAEEMRRHLATVQERHGWLYRELAAHPEISELVNELALWGF
jgi:hypothetical protein